MPARPMPSKASVPGAGTETLTASRYRKAGSSRKLKVNAVLAPVACVLKLNRVNGITAGLVTLNSVCVPNITEKSAGLLPGSAPK